MPTNTVRWLLTSGPRKMSMVTAMLGLAALALLIWIMGFRGLVCTSSLPLNTNQLMAPLPVDMVFEQASLHRTQHDYFPDFDANINVNQTVFKHMFRSLQPLADSELIENSAYFRPRQSVINPLMTRYLIEPVNICSGTNGAPYILIMIPSLSYHITLRQTIRDTWGSVVRKPWPKTRNLPPLKIVFVFGRSYTKGEEQTLETESAMHGDILFVDFFDSYRNLTYKSLTSLHWASTRCPEAKFFMKVDEDTFVNVPYLVQFLLYHERDLHKSVIGYAISKPVSVRTGRWAVMVSAYPLPIFPRYLFGHSYVISSDLCQDLVNVSMYMPFVPVEDAFVTGVLARVLNASRLHNPMFAVMTKSFTCSIVKHIKLTITMISESSHRLLWEAVKSGNCSYQFLPKKRSNIP